MKVQGVQKVTTHNLKLRIAKSIICNVKLTTCLERAIKLVKLVWYPIKPNIQSCGKIIMNTHTTLYHIKMFIFWTPGVLSSIVVSTICDIFLLILKPCKIFDRTLVFQQGLLPTLKHRLKTFLFQVKTVIWKIQHFNYIKIHRWSPGAQIHGIAWYAAICFNLC